MSLKTIFNKPKPINPEEFVAACTKLDFQIETWTRGGIGCLSLSQSINTATLPNLRGKLEAKAKLLLRTAPQLQKSAPYISGNRLGQINVSLNDLDPDFYESIRALNLIVHQHRQEVINLAALRREAERANRLDTKTHLDSLNQGFDAKVQEEVESAPEVVALDEQIQKAHQQAASLQLARHLKVEELTAQKEPLRTSYLYTADDREL